MNYSVARKACMVALMVLLPLSLVHAEGLKGITRIFVDKMDNDLDQYLRAEFSKQFKGKVVVVLDASPDVGFGEDIEGTDHQRPIDQRARRSGQPRRASRRPANHITSMKA